MCVCVCVWGGGTREKYSVCVCVCVEKSRSGVASTQRELNHQSFFQALHNTTTESASHSSPWICLTIRLSVRLPFSSDCLSVGVKTTGGFPVPGTAAVAITQGRCRLFGPRDTSDPGAAEPGLSLLGFRPRLCFHPDTQGSQTQ